MIRLTEDNILELLGYFMGLVVSLMLFISPLIHFLFLSCIAFAKVQFGGNFIDFTIKSLLVSYIIFGVYFYIILCFLFYGTFIL